MKLRRSINWLRLQQLLWWTATTALFVIAIALILALTPLLLCACAWWLVSERLFLWRLRRTGRRKPWAEIRARMANRRGTLILEADLETGRVRRVWWFPEHLLKLFPSAPWTSFEAFRRINDAANSSTELTPAGREWCEHDLPKLAPAAILIDVVPELLWSYLTGPTAAPHSIVVVPFPALTHRAKKSKPR